MSTFSDKTHKAADFMYVCLRL